MTTPSTGAASVRPASDRIGAAQPAGGDGARQGPGLAGAAQDQDAAHQPAALPDDAALAVDHHHLDRDVRSDHLAATCRAAPPRDRASGKAGRLRLRQHLARRVGARRSPPTSARGAPCPAASSASAGWSSRERAECRSRWPCASLASLAKPPARGQPRHRMTAQILERAAGEIAHVEQRHLGQAVERAARLAPRSSRWRPRHGRARPRGRRRCRDGSSGSRRHSCRAPPRPWCRGSTVRRRCPSRPFRVFCASSSPPGMAMVIGDVRRRSGRRRDLGDGLAHHLARHRVDRGLARRELAGLAGSPCRRPARVEGDARCPAAPGRTVARTRQPWVTSGSSPASLTTAAVAAPACTARARPARSWPFRRAAGGSSPGRRSPGRPAHRRPPWPPPWRRRPWSSRGAARAAGPRPSLPIAGGWPGA